MSEVPLGWRDIVLRSVFSIIGLVQVMLFFAATGITFYENPPTSLLSFLGLTYPLFISALGLLGSLFGKWWGYVLVVGLPIFLVVGGYFIGY